MTDESPMMVHYLLAMHREDKELMRLELHVPVTAFYAIQAQTLLSLETLLVDYGKTHGFVRLGTTQAAADASGSNE